MGFLNNDYIFACEFDDCFLNIGLFYNIVPGNGVAPSPTPWCSSYRKGSLRVTLDYGR